VTQPVEVTEAAVVARLRAAGCVFAEDEARILLESAATPEDLDVMVGQRVTGLPLEHVVGWAEFCGLRIEVDPGVFVPRQRTELLVRRAAQLCPPHAVVVDLACGSGAIGRAVAARTPIDLYAADIEPAAVACARRNLAPVGGHVHQGDLYEALPGDLRGRVDVVVANVPYVPSEAVGLMPPEARLFEPLTALDGGADGLDLLRRAAAGAGDWLRPGGHLLVETSLDQAPAAAQAYAVAGLAPAVERDDELGATVVIGTWLRSSGDRGR
jgi:release factor glutamine methyltransferase